MDFDARVGFVDLDDRNGDQSSGGGERPRMAAPGERGNGRSERGADHVTAIG
jgi:hypothetical protein